MTGVLRRPLSSLCFVLVLASMAPNAAAQSPATPSAATPSAPAQSEEERAAARSLATQGITAYNAGRYAEALDLFTRAETLLHAPPHVLYMARSAAKVGRLVRARELYLKVVREQLPAAAPQAFRDAQIDAQNEVKQIEPRLASIVIKVTAPPGVSFRVEMDKKSVSAAMIGVPIPEDPGKHQLAATAPGYKSKLVEVTLQEGGQGSAELVLEPSGENPAGPGPALAPNAAPQAGAPSQPAPAAATRESSDGPATWMRPVSYVALGVGVLGIGAGSYFGLKSRSERRDANQLADQCGTPCLNSNPVTGAIDDKDNSARKHLTFSIVSFVVGGVGAATGATLFVLSTQKRQSARTINPYVGWGSAGLSGSW